MLQEIEKPIEQHNSHFKKGRKNGFTNSKFSFIVDEEVDIYLPKGNGKSHPARGKHRSLVRGAFTLHTFRKGGWRK